MPAIIKIQSVESVTHAACLIDYLGDAMHPRHECVHIIGCYGLHCSSKSEFIHSLEEAEARRAARKKKRLKAKALHLMGGTTPGLVLNENEQGELLKAFLEEAPMGLPVIYAFHKLPGEDCEDYHFVISGYDASSDDQGLRLSPSCHPQSFLTRQLNEVIKRIEAGRKDGAQPRYSVAPWHLNRKRKPKLLIEQVELMAARNPDVPLHDILEAKLHYPIISGDGDKYKVVTWNRVSPVTVEKTGSHSLRSRSNQMSTLAMKVKSPIR